MSSSLVQLRLKQLQWFQWKEATLSLELYLYHNNFFFKSKLQNNTTTILYAFVMYCDAASAPAWIKYICHDRCVHVCHKVVLVMAEFLVYVWVFFRHPSSSGRSKLLAARVNYFALETNLFILENHGHIWHYKSLHPSRKSGRFMGSGFSTISQLMTLRVWTSIERYCWVFAVRQPPRSCQAFQNVEAGGHPFLRVDFHCWTTLESEAINDSAARQAEYIQAGKQWGNFGLCSRLT